jgi:hypothetical protein
LLSLEITLHPAIEIAATSAAILAKERIDVWKHLRCLLFVLMSAPTRTKVTCHNRTEKHPP